MQLRVLLLWLPACIAWVSCSETTTQSAEKQAQTAEKNPDGMEVRESPKTGDKYVSTPKTAREGGGDKFPYVEIAGGRSLRLEAFDMDFNLTHNDKLFPMTNEQVKWIKPGSSDDLTGTFITYIYHGYGTGLEYPYITVSYIARTHPQCPECATVASTYKSIEKMMGSGAGSKIGKMSQIKTADGHIAYCKDIYSAPVAVDAAGKMMKAEKYIGYAYIEYSPKYIVGLCLTVPTKETYQFCKPAFEDLIKSFTD